MRVYQFHHFGINSWLELYLKSFLPLEKARVEVVPGTGLEPAYLTAYAPQTYVSTNFTTRANLFCWGGKGKKLFITRQPDRNEVLSWPELARLY